MAAIFSTSDCSYDDPIISVVEATTKDGRPYALLTVSHQTHPGANPIPWRVAWFATPAEAISAVLAEKPLWLVGANIGGRLQAVLDDEAPEARA